VKGSTSIIGLLVFSLIFLVFSTANASAEEIVPVAQAIHHSAHLILSDASFNWRRLLVFGEVEENVYRDSDVEVLRARTPRKWCLFVLSLDLGSGINA